MIGVSGLGGLGIELVTGLRQRTKALKRTGPRSSCGVDGDGGSEDGLQASDRGGNENGLRRVSRGGFLNGLRACCRQSIEEMQGPCK